MNIVFKKIHIKNFQSVENIELELDSKGIVVVKGINNYEANVKSNGSGKSSIFESIIFSLYGETSLGIKDPENRILNQGYRVSLDLSINGINYTIIRYKENGKSNIQLLENGIDVSGRNKTDTDKLIQKYLGINKDLFLDSIFLAQGVSTNLSSLSPTARKERLEILTGTEKLIEDFKLYIKNKQIEYEAECTRLTLDKTKLEGNIQSLQSQINTLNSKINDIKIENEKKKSLGNVEEIDIEINQIHKDINILNNDIVDIENIVIPEFDSVISNKQLDMDNLKSNRVEIENKREEINNILNTQRDLVNKLSSEVDKWEFEISNFESSINRLNSEIDSIRKSDTCPTCGRKYDNANEEHILNLIKEKETEILDIQNKIQDNKNLINNKSIEINTETEKGKQIREQYDLEQNRIQNIDNQIQDIEKYIQDNQNKIREQRELISSKQNQIGELQNKKDMLQGKKEELLKVEIQSTAEYEEMIDEANSNINSSNIQIREIESKWNEQNDLVDVCKYSQQLITKPFRTYLLQNSIKILNDKLEYLSNRLFSNHKDVIIIDGDDSKLDIRLGNASYESLSGGEKTRVNICLLLAQKYLASNLGNVDCNLIVLDEVLGQCDSDAEMNIIDLIIEELQSVSSIIFIGHKELTIPNDGTITVIKDENGLSRLLNK